MAFFTALYQFLEEDGDKAIVDWLWKPLLFVLALASLIKVPYGKNYDDKGGLIPGLACASVKVPARQVWFIMELPCLVIPVFLLLNVGGRYANAFNPNMALLCMFMLHYSNRVLIYPFTLRGQDTPVFVVLSGIFTCSINGYLQGRYLTNYASYELSWFYDPRFLIGHILFLLGMAINVHSDSILRSLRKPGETAYKIPHGGMFEYVSGANYFGEALEWTGYAIACWSVIGAYIAVCTTVFLGPRALQYHQFYQRKFEDYPKNRRAFIPFIL